MKNIVLKSSLVFFFICLVAPVFSQYTFFTPEGSFAIEVSLENTNMKRLPIYRNAIMSLSVVDQFAVGGTAANEELSPFIFSASLENRKLVDFIDVNEVVEGQNAIQSGFVRNKQGQLFAGTMPQHSSKTGGHLIKVELDASGTIKVEDLGIPVEGEGIFSLTSNASFTTLYGISHPSGYFFSFDIKSGKTKVFKDLAPDKTVALSLEERFSLEPEDFLSKALITDNKGCVYGSLPFGRLFYFNPSDESLNEIDSELPRVWGRRSIGQIDCWLKTKSGKIFGANRADGQLFELNPETLHIKNLGKPIMMPGIAGLAEGADGKIYGIAGGAPAYSHLFSYNETEGFVDYGNPEFLMVEPGIEQGILWRGFQLSTIAASDNGEYIVMGENESLSQLMVFLAKP